MFIDLITTVLRRICVGSSQDFFFKKVDYNSFEISAADKINLYIHVHFCKSLCPYCPYNRIKYDEKLVKPYTKSLLKEIDLYAGKLGKIEVSSIYIGGGTPTNIVNELGIIIDKIKTVFEVSADIAIETTVSDINDYTLKKLKQYGINLVSLGVQSFSNKYLKMLGRDYDSSIIPPSNVLSSFANKSRNDYRS
jgi:oxygen-independent coproporphyrinogen-3 oxidase